jgi:hypothetical protein
MSMQRIRGKRRKKYGNRKRMSKNDGRICEKHYTTNYRHQHQDRNEEKTNKKRRRKPLMDKKKDKEDRKRKLELKKK